jgi:hypothetical protein
MNKRLILFYDKTEHHDDDGLDRGGIECWSASNSLEGALEKRKKR